MHFARILLGQVVLYGFLATSLPAAGAAEPIPGIGPAGPIEPLHTGFAFTEGPAADAEGNVYFTDIPNNKILRVDSQGNLSTFVDHSRHANGLMFRSAREMIACEMDGQLVAWDVVTKQRRVLAAEYNGKRFNAPNDLTVDRHGGVYFTDPHFRAPSQLPQDKMGVYYVSSEGKVDRLIDNLEAPNGIILSNDEKTLYVFPSRSSTMRAYPIEAPGNLGKGRDFCTVESEGERGMQGTDGVTIDSRGNLYLTTAPRHPGIHPQGKATRDYRAAGGTRQRHLRRPRAKYPLRHCTNVTLCGANACEREKGK